MKLEAMSLFALVAEHGSFTAAARETGLLKSTVSQRIAQLEKDIGLRLLHRSTRKISLTSAGEVYLLHCQEMLAAVEAADAAASRLREAPSGIIRITSPEAFGEIILPNLIAAFKKQHPQVEMELKITDIYLDLIAERLDFAFRAGSPAYANIIARHLGALCTVLVASPDYLAAHGSPETPEDLKTHVLLCHTAMPLWRLETATGRINIDVSQTALKSSSLGCLLGLATQGLGIAFLPWFLAKEKLEDGALHTVLPHFRVVDNTYYLLYPSRKNPPAAQTAFLSFMATYPLALLLSPHRKSPAHDAPRTANRPPP